MRKIAIFSLGLLVAFVVSTAAVWMLLVQLPAAAIKRLTGSIEEMAGSLGITAKVVVGERTVLHGPRRITELAVLSQKINQTYTWQHEHLFSTKSIEFSADFTAKVGYRFNSPLEIRVTREMDNATMLLPKAEILSNEMSGFRIVKDQSGLWNRISDADRQRAIHALKLRAEEAFVADGLLDKADEAMQSHLSEAFEKAGKEGAQIHRTSVELP